MTYIPQTNNVQPKLSSPNTLANPYDGSVSKAASEFLGKGEGLIQGILDKRDAEKTAMQELRTTKFEQDYADQLKEFNKKYALLITSGSVDTSQATYKKMATEHFNEFAKTVDWHLDKPARAKLETTMYGKIREGYGSLLSNDLKTLNAEQSIDLLGQVTDQLLQKSTDPTMTVEEIAVQLQEPAVQKMLETIHGKDNYTDVVNNYTSQFYEKNTQAKIEMFYQKGDVEQLDKLHQSIGKNTFFTAEKKEQLAGKLTLAKQRLKGLGEANQYIETYQNKEGIVDLKSALDSIKKRDDLSDEEKSHVNLELTQKAKQINKQTEQQYQQLRTLVVMQLLETGNTSNISGEVWGRLRPEDIELIKNYTEVTQTNSDSYNELLFKAMNMEQVDMFTAGLDQLTAYDLKELQTVQNNLKKNPELQKQAKAINTLMANEFSKRNIADNKKKLEFYALIMEEINGRQRVTGQPLSNMKIAELINKFFSTQFQ